MKTLIVLILTLIVTGFSSNAQQSDYKQGEVIIQLNWHKSIDKVLSRLNEDIDSTEAVQVKKVLSKRLNIWLLKFDANLLDINRVIGLSNRIGDVYAAQKNHLISQRVTVPNDPLFNTLWGMDNTGQTGGTPDVDIDAPEAWDIATGGVTELGDTIVVAVVDGGFDLNHEDLNFWKNRLEIPGNGVDDDGNGYIDDFDGWDAVDSDGTIGSDDHGTHVAGTVGAIGDNGIGVTGVNWNVQVMPVVGSSGDEAIVIEAYGYVYELRATYNETNGDSGAFVVSTNSSFGVNEGDPAQYPIWCGFYDSLGAIGVLNCGATMNQNSDVDQVGDIPTACPSPYMISVTNTDKDDQKNSSAAYGLTTIDLGAPGTDITSTVSGNTYSEKSGTSMATPHVAGAIGLLYSVPCGSLAALSHASPSLAAMQVRQYILDGVDVIAGLTGITVTGGRLNLYKSVLQVVANCSQSACPMPYAVDALSITESGAVMSWSTLADSSFNIRYMVQGDSIWTTDSTTDLTYNLLGLTECTMYEFQIETVCDTSNSGFTGSYIFTTDGCCSAPEGLVVSGVTDVQATLNWDDVLAASGYNVQIKAAVDTVWVDYAGIVASSQVAGGLIECTEYEFQVQSICNTELSPFSASFVFTSSCGACTDITYCSSVGDDTSEEWIESISIGDLVNVSGNDNGSADYTDLSTYLILDSTYTMILTPGYTGPLYDEYFMVWIDYNQDGDFDDTDEMIYGPGTGTQAAVSTNVTIPASAVKGSSRMRVSMKFNSDPAACEANFNFGEVEDYCVNIIEPEDTVSGVKGLFEQSIDITLLPNPAGSSVTVKLRGRTATRVSLITLLGKEVWSTQNVHEPSGIEIDLSSVAIGIYVVKIETADWTYTRRLVHN